MGRPLLDPSVDDEMAIRAASYLKRTHQPIVPRKQWPAGEALPTYGFAGRIGPALCSEPGRALCLWRDAGWGRKVADGRCVQGRFDDELVAASVALVREWAPTPAPAWVAGVPSLARPQLVPDFAQRLARALDLPFHACVAHVGAKRPQREMENSVQQARNLDGAFAVEPCAAVSGPCLLVDDAVSSGWTLTVVAALLRRAGCPAVFPLALAVNSSGLA
jgi:ATP-dependent DNA helicase RecQ